MVSIKISQRPQKHHSGHEQIKLIITLIGKRKPITESIIFTNGIPIEITQIHNISVSFKAVGFLPNWARWEV